MIGLNFRVRASIVSVGIEEIDVLEANYGGDITKMPYVVNKEAFAR